MIFLANKKRKELTPLQQEYKKLINKRKRRIREAEKRGYQLVKPVKLDYQKVDTKLVERLRKETTTDLYKKMIFSSPDTGGEILTGLEGRKFERRLSARKAKETKQALEYVKKNVPEMPELPQHILVNGETFDEWLFQNEPDFEYQENVSTDTQFYERVIIANFLETATGFRCAKLIIGWLYSVIGRYGEHETAKMIQEAGKNGLQLGVTVRPSDKEEVIANFLSEMLNFMAEVGEFSRDEIMRALEEEEVFVDYA